MNIDWPQFPSLTALRAFAAAAHLRSFSGAARMLNVTHAAVAQQVRGLEQHLGVSLINKQGRGLALTADGEALAAALSDGFGRIDAGIKALGQGSRESTVHISLTASFAAQWLMPRLRSFWTAHPDIGLSLHPDARVVDLRATGVDVAIRYGMGQWAGVDAKYLTSARMVIAGAPDLLHGKRPPVTALGTLPWVLPTDWPEGRNWLHSLGVELDENELTELPNDELAISAARQGLGLIAESHALLEEDIRRGDLVLLFEAQEKLPAYFAVTQPVQQRRAVRVFLKWLADSA
jgi:LysR family transcriptional regulator, glycine cleavage system transcriptional activator